MAEAQLRRIAGVQARPGYRLALTWERSPAPPVIIDLSDMISLGGVFKELSDHSKFAAVTIGENKRIVQWPEPKDDLGHPVIEIDADSLFEKYREQRNDGLAKSLVEAVALTSPLRRSFKTRPRASS